MKTIYKSYKFGCDPNCLERGGVLVVSGLKKSVGWLPVKTVVEEGERWKGLMSSEGLTGGLGPSDFHWRQVTKMPLIKEIEGGAILDGQGMLAEARYGKGRIVLIQADVTRLKETLETSWRATHDGYKRSKTSGAVETQKNKKTTVDDIGAVIGGDQVPKGTNEDWVAENVKAAEKSLADSGQAKEQEKNKYDSQALKLDMPRAKCLRIFSTVLANLGVAFEANSLAADEVDREASPYVFDVADFNPYFYTSW